MGVGDLRVLEHLRERGRDPATTVKRNIPSAQAVDELIALIKEGGDWVEPE